MYPELAAAPCRLIVMHAVQGLGRAQRLDLSPDAVWQRIEAFFSERIARLYRDGLVIPAACAAPGRPALALATVQLLLDASGRDAYKFLRNEITREDACAQFYCPGTRRKAHRRGWLKPICECGGARKGPDAALFRFWR